MTLTSRPDILDNLERRHADGLAYEPITEDDLGVVCWLAVLPSA